MKPIFIGPVSQYPARALLIWYAILVSVGSLLLACPFSVAAGASAISWTDAAFTATSAACVTGLAVRSTGTDFSFMGQLVILGLIQFGGLGIMTAATLASFAFKGRETLRHRAAVAATLRFSPAEQSRQILKRVVLVTLVVEGTGAMVLLVHQAIITPRWSAPWWAIFHSVSAFCNAGFALADDSMTPWQGSPVVCLAIVALIVIGGIGYPVIADLQANGKRRWPLCWEQLQLHTKIMLLGSAILLAVGAIAFYTLERTNTLQDMSAGRGMLVALFHSASSRTAGFCSVPISGLTNATLFVLILWMMVGAGPGSTGGGFKVTTLAVLALFAKSRFRGDTGVTVFRRTIPHEIIGQAITAVMLFALVATLGLTVLLISEESGLPHTEQRGGFLDMAFEVVSALGTVGLSTGITATVSAFGKWILILLMLVGRLGPLTVVVVLTGWRQGSKIAYAQEEVLIG